MNECIGLLFGTKLMRSLTLSNYYYHNICFVLFAAAMSWCLGIRSFFCSVAVPPNPNPLLFLIILFVLISFFLVHCSFFSFLILFLFFVLLSYINFVSISHFIQNVEYETYFILVKPKISII